MKSTTRAARSALVVIAAALGVAGASSSAVAQRIAHAGTGGQAIAPPTTVPYAGATVMIQQPFGNGGQRFPGLFGHHHRLPFVVIPQASYYPYYPVPTGYPYYPQGGYGGAVYDANGRPLYNGYDANGYAAPGPTPNPNWYPSATPDLSGSPYVAIEGGVIVVDFGNGDSRSVPSCAAQPSLLDPDGRPRTIFYTPSVDGVILRPGQRGRVLGAPGAGARACYSVDAYGRMELRY
jgi:hypothetical protein